MPHERIVGLHESCRVSAYSFLAEQFPPEIPTFLTEDAEMVIGLQPELVITSFYSSAAFKHQLDLAEIPHVQTGFFGDIDDIREQIHLFGDMLGVEASARQLLQTMAHNSQAICTVVAQRLDGKVPTLLYYDRMGFVAGKHTLFDALCRRLGVKNAASEHGNRLFQADRLRNGVEVESRHHCCAGGQWPEGTPHRPTDSGHVERSATAPHLCDP